MNTRVKIAAVLVLIVVLAGGTYFATRSTTSDSPNTTPSSVAIPEPALSSTVAFLGDSYTAGNGASVSTNGYAYQVSKLGCWADSVFAEPGTGYTNDGIEPGYKVFGDRVSEVVASKPNVVIVQGGTNDRDPVATSTAAAEVFSTLKRELPGVEVIALGPVAAPKLPTQQVAAVGAAIADAAKANGVPYIDPSGWIPNSDFVSDKVHPNNDGHTELAKRLYSAVTALKVPGLTACA